MTGWFWNTGKQYVTPEQVFTDTKIICIAYKWRDDKKTHVLTWNSKHDEKEMLESFVKTASEADAVIGHNGKYFDLRHIQARLAFYRLSPLPMVFIGDTLLSSRRALKLPSHKLSYLAKFFGVGGKVETGGIDLWHDVLKGSKSALKKMCDYCKGDVTLLEKVHKKLEPYINVYHTRATIPMQCPSCKGRLRLYGTYRVSGVRKVQRFLCTACGRTCHDGNNLLVKPKDLAR